MERRNQSLSRKTGWASACLPPPIICHHINACFVLCELLPAWNFLRTAFISCRLVIPDFWEFNSCEMLPWVKRGKDLTAPRCLINVLLCNMSRLSFVQSFHKNVNYRVNTKGISFQRKTDTVCTACVDSQPILWAREVQLDIIMMIIFLLSFDFCD